MRMKRLGAAVAAVTLAGIGFLASASPASATDCDWYRKYKPDHLPEKCKPKTTTTTKAETTTTKAETTTTVKVSPSTVAPSTTVKPDTKPTPVKAKPKFTG